MTTTTVAPRDTLGYRGKIAVVVPATNTVVQPEYESMRPAGITNHVTRMLLPPRPYTDMAAYQRALETEQGQLEDALGLVLPAEPDIVAHGHSIHSFRGDLARAEAERRALEAFCKMPFITPSLAVIAGLAAIGGPRRLGVLTPYWPPADALVAAFFRSAGYDPVRTYGMKCEGPTKVAKVTAAAILAAFETLDAPEVEAFVHVGTNLPVTALTEAIEAKHGKPLIGVNVATYWAALRTIGVGDRMNGFGLLLERF